MLWFHLFLVCIVLADQGIISYICFIYSDVQYKLIKELLYTDLKLFLTIISLIHNLCCNVSFIPDVHCRLIKELLYTDVTKLLHTMVTLISDVHYRLLQAHNKWRKSLEESLLEKDKKVEGIQTQKEKSHMEVYFVVVLFLK